MPTPNEGESEEEFMGRCMAYPDLQKYESKQRAAICHSKFRGDSMERKIGFDTMQLDGKILVDDDVVLTMPAVIASEIVHQYDDGWAYKPADELEKMATVANRIGSVPVKILEHPSAETNYLLVKQSDVYGKASNFQFVKNLTDTKTKRPSRRGVKADISWFKDVTPTDVIEKIKTGTLHDVSIGFTFDSDPAGGDFEGTHYDYTQRNIFLNHLAAPIEAGRCPGPICGIGYDANTVIRVDAALLNECPVCRRIKEVGFSVAGKRLYKQYGDEVLEVIEGNPLPEPPKTSLTEEFNKTFKELNEKLNQTT